MAAAAHPSFAHGLLAQIALRKKDLDEAEREARLAMDDESLRLGPMITLAEVLHARRRLRGGPGDHAPGRGRLRPARGQGPGPDPRPLADPRQDPGRPRGRRGSRGRLPRRRSALFPDDVRAYSNLAILYALTGRPGRGGADPAADGGGEPPPGRLRRSGEDPARAEGPGQRRGACCATRWGGIREARSCGSWRKGREKGSERV